jgi:predicted dienelactone hydrolase
MKYRKYTLALGMLLFCSLLLVQSLSAAEDAAAYSARPGPRQVAVLRDDWKDQARDRMIPVKIYYPRDAAGPFPIILFSHGLGGSREGYEYLGRHWAGYGYVSVHIQHLGSDTSVWQGKEKPMEAMKAAIRDIKTSLDRPTDVKFAIDQLIKLNRGAGPLKGRLDLDRIGMAGHSYGAWTTLVIAGQGLMGPRGNVLRLADPRVKAALPMSASIPMKRSDFAAVNWERAPDFDRIYAGIKIPVMHMTGTRDDSPISGAKAADRRVPFDHIKNAEQYLLIFNGGDHGVFSRSRGAHGRETQPKDAVFQDLILVASTAFWDACLKNSKPAKRFLAEDFAKVLGKEGTWEKKP